MVNDGIAVFHDSFPWLTIIGLIPLAGAVVVALFPAGRDLAVKRVALLFSLVTLVWAAVMTTAYDTTKAGFQFAQSTSWIGQLGISYAVGTDGIGLVLILLTTVLVPVVVLASWHESHGFPGRERPSSVRTFYALLLSLETMMIGVFAATDVFLFYVFFEVMLIPMYFLIGQFGGAQRSYASIKFLLYSLAGGAFMLAALIGLYVQSEHQLGRGTFNLFALEKLHLSGGLQDWLFAGFAIAFAIKAPLWPFHTWLPDAGAEAPTGAGALLVGILDKVGTFGFIRYCIPLFPEASETFAPYIVGLGVAGVLYGALVAMAQRDWKRLVSYTSIAHFGFIAMGVFAFTSQGGTGAVLYMVNHGLSTGALFLVVGFLVARRGTPDIPSFGGVSRPAPLFGGVFLFVGLSSLALPGLNTFASEFLVLVGSFTRYRVAAIVATTGIILAALYVLVAYQRTFHGPVKAGIEHLKDLNAREIAVVGPVLALIVLLGVYPKPLIDIIQPSVTATYQQAHRTDPPPLASTAAQDQAATVNGGGK